MRRNQNCYLSGSFIQRTRKFFTEENGLASRNVLSVALDASGNIWAATDAGLACMKKDKFVPFKLKGIEEGAAVNYVYCDYENVIWAAAGNILFEIKSNKIISVTELPSNVIGIDCGKDGVKWLMCVSELFKYVDGTWVKFLSGASEGTYCSGATCVAAYEGDLVYVGTPISLLTLKGKRYHWRNLKSDKSNLISDNISAVKFDRWGHLWIGTDKGVVIYDNKNCWKDGSTLEELPKMNITCIEFDKCGGRYFGTDKGLIYYKNGKRRFFGPRIWIPDFNVNAVAVTDDGMKICVATSDGLSVITGQEITLRDKERHYQEMTEKYYLRRDYCINRDLAEYENIENGFVGPSDNDGLWTGCYIASQSFKYATTGDKKALENAKKSMKALIHLVDITGIPGFSSRAVRYPGDRGFGNGNREWHLAEDGSCEWKGETSSDEMVGHFFAYATYFDFCADAKDKKEIKRVITSIMDHIMRNDYHLCDIDGKPTTWASWSPADLNDDDKWVWERCVNSLEILTMLKATYHISGDEKYNDAYKKFITEYHYALNAAQHKMPDYHTCHIDENLGFLSSITLLRLEEDEDLRALYLMGLKHIWKYEEIEENPFWNMIYGIFTGNECHLESVVNSLREYNLDLIVYSYSAEGRDDVEIDTDPELIGEPIQLKKPLPYPERVKYNYDRNPFEIEINHGYEAEYPVVFTMPYWIARYYGIIKEANDED